MAEDKRRTWVPGGRRTGRSRRGRGQASLAELVTRFMATAPVGALTMRLGAAWERGLPPRIVRASSPVMLRRDVLHVHTTTSAWSQEIVLMQSEILARLKFLLPDLTITSIKARVGAFPKRAPVREKPQPKFVPLAESELPSSVKARLHGIHDERLREAISAAARMSLSRTRHPDATPPDPLEARRVKKP